MTMQISTNRRSPNADTNSMLRTAMLLLAPVLKTARDELAEAMTQRFLTGVAAHHHVMPDRQEIVRAYRAHLDEVVNASEVPGNEQARIVGAVAATHGRAGAAAGVPLAIQVEFYRLGLRALLEAVLVHDGGGSAERRIADAVSAVWTLQDNWVQRMTAAYYRESGEAIRSREQHRSALVGRLLDGHVQDTAELWDAAQALWLPHDSRYVVVTLEVPSTCHQQIRVVQSRLSRAGIASAWRLLPDGQAVVAGIAAVGGDAGQRVLSDVLAETWDHRVGISPQFCTLDSAHRAARFARLAMASAPRGSGRVTVFEEAPVAVVVAASPPDVLAEMVRTVLGSLNQLPDDDRGVLIGTLRTWLSCGGSTDATAKALFCHPNTVRYRLNRVSEHTSRSLTDPQAVAELTVALQGDLLARCA